MDLTAPRARRTDPATSHDAAEKAARFAHGHHLRIRNFLDGIAPRAATYIDIAAGTDLDRHAVGRRLKELFEAGMIEKAGIGALPNGNKATLWRAI
jgi:hypothetical protein